jgi:hypothetical protein
MGRRVSRKNLYSKYRNNKSIRRVLRKRHRTLRKKKILIKRNRTLRKKKTLRKMFGGTKGASKVSYRLLAKANNLTAPKYNQVWLHPDPVKGTVRVEQKSGGTLEDTYEFYWWNNKHKFLYTGDRFVEELDKRLLIYRALNELENAVCCLPTHMRPMGVHSLLDYNGEKWIENIYFTDNNQLQYSNDLYTIFTSETEDGMRVPLTTSGSPSDWEPTK